MPSRRKFVLLGDEGIHARVGQAFWESTVASIGERLRAGEVTAALVDAIERLGEQLAQHFPFRGDQDVNELPDVVDRL